MRVIEDHAAPLERHARGLRPRQRAAVRADPLERVAVAACLRIAARDDDAVEVVKAA